MDLLYTILITILTLGILVTFHEFGHFWVARRCGVRVLRFSVGFGKGLWRWHGRDGTEYVIAAIPLGGYVKMLDEREGKVPDEELAGAFNRQSVWARIAIVMAGPLANFLLAIVAFWLLFTIGVTGLSPVIGDVQRGSLAESAGLESSQEIIAVDGEPTPTRQAVLMQLPYIVLVSLDLFNSQFAIPIPILSISPRRSLTTGSRAMTSRNCLRAWELAFGSRNSRRVLTP